jgi:hypothetical protein
VNHWILWVAEPLFLKAVEGFAEVLGKKHLDTLKSCDSLARCLDSQGKSREAEPLRRRAAEGMEEALRKKHPDTLNTYAGLVTCFYSQGKSHEAEPLFRKAVEGLEEVFHFENTRIFLYFGSMSQKS